MFGWTQLFKVKVVEWAATAKVSWMVGDKRTKDPASSPIVSAIVRQTPEQSLVDGWLDC
jgi:hypothetical protein